MSATLAFSTAQASATYQNYCYGSIVAAGQDCSGPRHSIVTNHVDGYAKVCAGAQDTNGQMYGSFNCDNTSPYTAEHTYAGANLLYPLAHNHDFGYIYQTVYGYMVY